MPLTKTKTYARILETQGFKQEALEIYEELLKETNDPEIVEAIERLKKRRFFEGVNVLRLKEFNEINQLNRYDFEKWLSEI
ncbi:tetratricopeptide repeat-containing protein [Nautilia lithotrophica]